MIRLLRAFARRIQRGELRNALYLSYYFCYLWLRDLRFKTKFAHSQRPDELGNPASSTGNFPAHPRLVTRLLRISGLPKQSVILDIGHGSGSSLFAAARKGYSQLRGIEIADGPFECSKENLKRLAQLSQGDARTVDLFDVDGIFFFNPFRGEVAKELFSRLPVNLKVVITMNPDLESVATTLANSGFRVIYSYRHPIYASFDAQIWRRKES